LHIAAHYFNASCSGVVTYRTKGRLPVGKNPKRRSCADLLLPIRRSRWCVLRDRELTCQYRHPRLLAFALVQTECQQRATDLRSSGCSGVATQKGEQRCSAGNTRIKESNAHVSNVHDRCPDHQSKIPGIWGFCNARDRRTSRMPRYRQLLFFTRSMPLHFILLIHFLPPCYRQIFFRYPFANKYTSHLAFRARLVVIAIGDFPGICANRIYGGA
jgi:hypothetical protein